MDELERLTPAEVEERIQLVEIEKAWGRPPIIDFRSLTREVARLRAAGKSTEVSVCSYEVFRLMQDNTVQRLWRNEELPHPYAMKIGAIVVVERICIDGIVGDLPPPQPSQKLEYSVLDDIAATPNLDEMLSGVKDSPQFVREIHGEWAEPDPCPPMGCRIDPNYRKPTCRKCGRDMGGE